ncbi:MAG: Gfo/Idh/MocA family oxidoreductase [Lentisphaerota bacterium]
MKKIRIGLIGCGRIVQASHVPALNELKSKAEISALFDINIETAKKIKTDFMLESKICSSVSALLKTEIDAVIVSTPNFTHYRLSMQALNAGKHVLIEKPIAANMRQADEMIALAKRKHLVLQVNQSLRFAPAYVKTKELIDSGIIGKPLHIRCLRASSTTPDKGWSPGASWFLSKKSAGGLVMDIAVHMADFLGWCFGETEKIFAISHTEIAGNDVPDNVTALFDFANGATGVLELSWTFPSCVGFLEIYGSKGVIRMGFNETELEMKLGNEQFKPVKIQKVKKSHTWFIESVSNQSSGNPATGEVGRHALAYCIAITQSAKSGKPVKPII